MPSTEYFRRQSDICLRLSLIASDDEVASRLIVMAQEYKAKADALAAESSSNNRSQRFARRRYKRTLDRLSWRYALECRESSQLELGPWSLAVAPLPSILAPP
jgi:hypothetical protein